MAHPGDLFLDRQTAMVAGQVGDSMPLGRKLLPQPEPHLFHGSAQNRRHWKKGSLEDGDLHRI